MDFKEDPAINMAELSLALVDPMMTIAQSCPGVQATNPKITEINTRRVLVIIPNQGVTILDPDKAQAVVQNPDLTLVDPNMSLLEDLGTMRPSF